MTNTKSKISKEPWVRIKPKAYYKMLVHVLRFGSKVKDQNEFKEVMGILVGHLEGEDEDEGIKNVIVDDAIPISHGGSIEVRFDPQDYAKFSTIDEQLANKNQFSVGWYHSHPNLGIFFSSTDIVNQLGWQTQWNPSGIGIVFDHAYLENENDPGFRTFRLDDPSKGQSSDYHEVHTIVEPPDTIDFYEKIINLINSVHTKEPPILERNEELDLFGAVQFPKEEKLISSTSDLNSDILLSSIKEGINGLIDDLTRPIISHFNKWSTSLIQETNKLNITMKNNLLEIKESLNDEMGQIQGSIDNNLSRNLNKLDDGIYVKIKNLIDKYNEIEKISSELTEQLEKTTKEELDTLSRENLSNFNALTKEVKERFRDNNTLTEAILDELELQNEEVKKLVNVIKDVQNETLEKVSTLQEQGEQEYHNSFQIIQEQINTIKERVSNFESQLDNCIVDFKESTETIQNKIEKLKKQKSDLQDTLNEEKEKKIELQEELHEIKEEKMQLQNSLNEVKEEKIDLQNQINNTNEENIELQNSIDKGKEEIEKLKSKLDDKKDETKELKSKIEKFQRKNKDFKDKIEELKKRDK